MIHITNMKILPPVFFLVCTFIAFDVAMAQTQGVADRTQSSSKLANPLSKLIDILKNKSIQADLEILDSQIEQLKLVREEMFRELNSKASELMSGNAHSGGEENRAAKEELRSFIKSRTRDYQKMLDKVLLPHQQKRLAEIALQERIQKIGPHGVLLKSEYAAELSELLGLSAAQKVKLKSVGQQARKKLIEKIEKAKSEAMMEILAVLDTNQRSQLEELMGQPFEPIKTAEESRTKLSSPKKNSTIQNTK